MIPDLFDISGGESHLMCHNSDDELKIIGENKQGQTKLKSPVEDLLAIAAGPN